MEPDYVKGYNNLGVYYEEIHDLEQAQEMYEQAIRLEPSYARAHFNLAELLYKKNEPGRALYHYRWSKQLGSTLRSESIDSLIQKTP